MPASPEQMPLEHWLPLVQLDMLGCAATHAVPLHQLPVAQEPSPAGVFDGHDVRQLVPPQTYGAQLVVVEPVHMPPPLQTPCVVCMLVAIEHEAATHTVPLA